MNIVSSPRFEEQLRQILAPLRDTDPRAAKSFLLYLNTILLNIPSKAGKYKPSIYVDHPEVRDIEHQGCTIPFYYDSDTKTYVLLGIIDNRSSA